MAVAAAAAVAVVAVAVVGVAVGLLGEVLLGDERVQRLVDDGVDPEAERGRDDVHEREAGEALVPGKEERDEGEDALKAGDSF